MPIETKPDSAGKQAIAGGLTQPIKPSSVPPLPKGFGGKKGK